MDKVIIPGFGKNAEIVDEDDDRFVRKSIEYFGHKPLESGGSIGQPERHNCEFEKSVRSAKGGFVLIALSRCTVVRTICTRDTTHAVQAQYDTRHTCNATRDARCRKCRKCRKCRSVESVESVEGVECVESVECVEKP